jgi:uncharacterized protein involved in copper resistance
MLRSAHCLGADGVLASAKNCAPLSAAVSKASAGALEVMTLHNTRNLPRTLADAAERGWAVVGAAAERDAAALAGFAVERPTVLVMGARRGGGRGARRLKAVLGGAIGAPPFSTEANPVGRLGGVCARCGEGVV